MTLLSALQGSMLHVIGWSLVHSVWIGVLVASCAWIAVSMLRGASAQSRYVILLLALTAIPVGAIACAVRTRTEFDRLAPAVAVGESKQQAEVAVPEAVATLGSTPEGPVTRNSTFEPETLETKVAADVPPRRAVAAPTDWPAPRAASLTPDIATYLPSLVCIWMVGVALLSVRLLLGCVCVRRLVSSGTPVPQVVADSAARIARRIQLHRAVQVVESKLAEVPATIGCIRPLILLPVSTLSSLSAQELDSILAHELAHIRRGDFLVNVFQTILDILLFYHPAVWWLSHSIRQEREHACDDLAIGVTGDRLQYARALATVAEQAVNNQLVLTATGGHFAQRIRRVLGQREARQAGALYVLSAGALVTILIGVALVLFQPASSTANDEKPELPSETTSAEQLEPITGTVLGPDSNPLADATVYLRRRPFRYHTGPLELAQAQTDDKGRFAFRDVVIPRLETLYHKDVFPVDVIAMKPGHALRWKRLTNAQTGISLKLPRESQYRGVLKNEIGEPVADATVRVRQLMSLNTLTKIDVAGGHTPSEDGHSFLNVAESLASISATTDEAGRFVLRELPHRVGLVLGIDDDRFVDAQWYAATTEEKLPDIRAGKVVYPPRPKTAEQVMRRRVSAELVPIHISPAEIAATRGVNLRVHVLDDRTGLPVPDATVVTLGKSRQAESKSLTDGDGVCDFHRLQPESELRLAVQSPDSSDLLGAAAVIFRASELHIDHEIRLARGAILAGRVFDMDSRAVVSGATVSFVYETEAAAGKQVQGISNEAGNFRLAVPEVTGRVAVSRAPAGYVRPRLTDGARNSVPTASVVTASLDQPVDNLEVFVQRRPQIPIAFVDAAGSPVAASADVRVFASSNSYFSSQAEVDDSGLLDVSLLERSPKPPTAIQILARSADKRLAGFFRTKEIAELQGGEPHRVVLRPTASVRGRILDKDTNAPIPGARVSLSVNYTATGGQGVASFTSDQEGKYRFEDLVPGMRYLLGANANGYGALNSIHTQFTAAEAEAHAVDIALVPAKPKAIADLQPAKTPVVDDLDPDKAYATLTETYTRDFAAYRDLLKKHRSRDLTSQIVSLREPTPVYAAAFMKLANDNQGTLVELNALKWICKAHQIAGTERRFQQLRTEAASRLIQDYHDREEIADAVLNIIYCSPESYAVARQLMNSPHHEVQGRACFTCAEIVAQRYLDPRGGHEVLREEAIELYQRVLDDYSEIPRWPGMTIGERAKNKLFELQHLRIGDAAPEIEGVDLDGKPMKLSEFRGKVVVIHYWQLGMPFFDRLEAIAAENKNKPLVILGVNTNADRAKVIAAAEQLGVAFRHWHDPDRKIHARWSDRWPDTHVISHDGKILYRGQRRPSSALEDVLDRAVAAAQQNQSKTER